MSSDDIIPSSIDADHIWHPYSAMHSDLPVYKVSHAQGSILTLDDGRELIDGMSSWWCMIHGYNQPDMNAALKQQIDAMSHVMFGGLTHEPAIELTKNLLKILPTGLDNIFYSDSGSVAVEVAMKMAVQYWQARKQPQKNRFASLRGGYHGDTFAAMSVCDPTTGMHHLFKDTVMQQVFISRPDKRFGERCDTQDLQSLRQILAEHQHELAALILEPIVQGAGGMWFYSADYLTQARRLCDEYDVLLIADEIATGFGRTGKLFACEHAGITPDIMCIGKALTGGYMSLAATITNNKIVAGIEAGEAGVFMHGPTFMANPLACTAANMSIQLLQQSPWQENIKRIEAQLLTGLAPCRELDDVADVRVLGAIGVVELQQAVDMQRITEAFVNAGVWIRPFGKLVYLMPPYIISSEQLDTLIKAIVNTLANRDY